MGAIPRDDKVSAAEWLGYTASDAKAMMEEAGYRVVSDVSPVLGYIRAK